MSGNDSDHQNPPKKKPCHLKLVVSNPDPAQEEPSFKTDPNAGMTVDAYKVGNSDILAVCDHFHRLLCRIPLKIDDTEGETGPSRSVLCDFPRVLGEQFNEFEDLNDSASEGEDFFGMITSQFQMKLLEQMLLFASDQDASSLVIRLKDGTQSKALWVYQHLAAYEDKVPTFLGVNTQLIILTNAKTFDKLLDLMDQAKQKFRRALWREQRNNSFVRWYLKRDPSLKFFSHES